MLGLTYPRLRTKLVNKVGETAVSILEKGAGLVQTLATKGPRAAGQELLAMAGDLVDNVRQQVEDGVRSWLAKTLLGRLVTELLKLLTPAGAVLTALEKTYTTVMFFIDKARQFQQLLTTIVNALAPIAAGNIGPAATKVEQVLGGLVPLALGFVADFIGLDGLTKAVREQLAKVRKVVDEVIDRLLDKVMALVAKLVKAGKQVAGKVIAGIKKFLGYRTEVDGGPGEQHELYFERRDGKVELIIESTPTVIRHFLLQYERKHSLKPSGFKYAPLTAVRNHLALYAPHYATLATFTSPDDPAAAPTHEALLVLNDQLSVLLRTLFLTNDATGILSKKTPASPLVPTLEQFKLEGITGRYINRPQILSNQLSYDHQPQARTLYDAAELTDQNGQRLFPLGSPLATRAPSPGAVYGYAINLSFPRHTNGRTYGVSALAAAFVANSRAITHNTTLSLDEKRDRIVDMLVDELNADVAQMRSVVSASQMNNRDIWHNVEDGLHLANPSIDPTDVLAFKKKIAERILQGERELLQQPMNELRKQ